MRLRVNPGSEAEFIARHVQYIDFTVNYQIRGETNSWWKVRNIIMRETLNSHMKN